MLDAIYAAFAQSWTSPGGADVARRELAGEAMFLARLITELMPEQPDALGLLVLMLHAEARRFARRTADGDYVPLAEQDISLWNGLLALWGSPVVAINRAWAVAEVHGVAAALAIIDALSGDRQLNEFQPYWVARAELLARAGDHDGARHAYDVAMGLGRDEAVRRFLQQQRSGL